MSDRPTPASVLRASTTLGTHLANTRKLLRLTAQQVAERADISRGTLRRIETGSASVSLEAVLKVARVLGILGAIVAAADPFSTDVGRARATEALPQRVRR